MSTREIENLKKQIVAGAKGLREALSELGSDVPANVFEELIAIYEQRSKILDGTYFGYTADFWTTEALPSGDDFNYEQEWKAFHRKYDPNHPENFPSTYLDTRNKIKDNNGDIIPGYIPATPSSNSSRPQGSETSSINKKDVCDIFGTKPQGNNKKVDKAHLLPFGRTVRLQWIGVAGAVLGLDPAEDNEQLLKATHGVKKLSNSGKNNEDESDTKPPAKKKQKSSNASNASDNRSSATTMTKREAGTGVVHFPENLIRLRNQNQAYDTKTPEVLIVPSLSLEQAREWKGGPYEAVVLAGFPYGAIQAGYTCSDASEVLYNIGATNSSRVSNFLALRNDREPVILDTALKSLKETLLAVVGYVKYMVKKVHGTIEEKDYVIFAEIKKKIDEGKNGLVVPKKRVDINSKPLLYVKFGAQEYFVPDTDTNSLGQEGAGTRENEGNLLHPAPDPLLLLVKAAVIWGRMTGVELIANGEEEDDDDSSDWDEDCPSHRADIPQEISVEIMSCAPEKTMKTKTMDFLLSV